MSVYLEADEAQHGHYNDGYIPLPEPAVPPLAYPPPVYRSDYSYPVQSHDSPRPHPHSPPSTPTEIEIQGTAPQPSPYTQQTDFQSNDEDLEALDRGDIPLLPRARPLYDGAEDPENTIRTSKIPQRHPRPGQRTSTIVELFQGNFVFDSAVPKTLLGMCPPSNEREFTHMRYSAATCDPDDFKDSDFTLRQVQYDPPRKTELFIVMTMYNEDKAFFCRTMHGVMENIAHLCNLDKSKTWGKEGWKKVVVCIVSDGRKKIDMGTLNVIATMGAYQEGVAKNIVDGKPVTAHIYEYTTQISVTPSLTVKFNKDGIVPVQIIFCLKEKNQKKINSHRWAFNAFGPILEPTVCVLLDVGTMPRPTSIYHLWKAFDINSNVGGACGEIVASTGTGKYGQGLINPLVAAQNFEYKMSNILDKPLESVFGYIPVLPGAFSAYRYFALKNDWTGEGPLQKYFLGESMHGAGADIFTANMYLAEDRILCWELVSKRGGAWILQYVKSASAVTDVPDQVPELISQRRRWLNGSFFAGIHSLANFHYIYRSSHSFMRKFWIHVELIYQCFNLFFSWFSLCHYWISFTILSQSLEDKSFGLGNSIHIVNVVIDFIFLGLLIMSYILSLGNRPQGARWRYTSVLIGFALITVYTMLASFFLVAKGIESMHDPESANSVFTNFIVRDEVIISLVATFGVYLAASLIFFEPWHMITSFLQYLLLAPSYISVLNVYAFANLHDVSWGTKGDNKISTDLGVANAIPDTNSVEVELPVEVPREEAYRDAIRCMRQHEPKKHPAPDPQTQREDCYRSFRTNVSTCDICLEVLLWWTLSNALLAVIIVTATGQASDRGAQNTVNGYLAFVFVSVAALALIRFIGSSTYRLVQLFAGGL